ncbi:hypothetical protein GOBAR_AA35187 [Gossypium barbadense]|uniref:TIR domain-containing protein n=1 Tax=Gossypium barbadense TaxID=3634 RepID=A0A2P5W390_GOSBA|nr:hypothetical protein GOBAR_AA35187 [Gossypium barbadense]
MIKASTYDVFLSFRGKDTRDGFVSHLYKDLCRRNIATFIDDEELRKGDEISGALLTAIQGSNHCFLQRLRCFQMQMCCSCFYGVDPSDVRKQRGSFADAFAKHEENFKHELEKVKTWRSVLTSAANLSGWDSKEIRAALQGSKNTDPAILFANLLLLNEQEREFLGNLLDGERTRIKINKLVLSALHLKDMNESFVQFVNEEEDLQTRLGQERA